MTRASTSLILFIVLFLLSTFYLVTFVGRPITGDDIWGATAILGNPIEVVIFTLRWDLHPPLYYSFLDIWAMAGKSDLWLRMSSSFLHALVTVIGFNYVWRRENLLAALLVTAIIFFSPLLFEFSTRIRMYSFISVLSICIFYSIEKYRETAEQKYLLSVFILGFILSYSHAIGILFVFFHFCYGFHFLLKDQSRVKIWVILHAILALLSLPAILNSMLKSVGHAVEPSISNIINVFIRLFFLGDQRFLILAILLFLLIFITKVVRPIVVCYIVLPIIFYSVISYTLKPLWLPRNFIFALPMIGIALAISINRLKIPRPAKLLIPCILIGISLSSTSFVEKRSSFKELVDVIQNESDGVKICIISKNTLHTFWSLQRYLNTPIWGNPIDVQPPLSDRWVSIAQRSPAFVSAALKLSPHLNYTDSAQWVISSGNTKRCEEPDIMNILIISDDEIDHDNLVFQNAGYSVYRQEVLPTNEKTNYGNVNSR